MPLLICLGIDNYAHAQTVATRPFFLGRVGPGNEVNIKTSDRDEANVIHRDIQTGVIMSTLIGFTIVPSKYTFHGKNACERSTNCNLSQWSNHAVKSGSCTKGKCHSPISTYVSAHDEYYKVFPNDSTASNNAG